MRKIEAIIIDAIRNKENFSSSGRDEVSYNDERNVLTVNLWGHTTATIEYDSNTIILSDCGYPTMTTMSRINAVTAALSIPVTFRIKNYCTTVYRNGELTEERDFSIIGWTVRIV